MPPKRLKKNDTNKVNSPKIRDYNKLNLNDVLCPICRSIMIEPVSLPCHHDFCLCCFDDTMKNANLVCPLCQIRIGSWWRKAQVQGKHVNQELQRAINRRFPRRVFNKLTGIEDDLEQPELVVANPEEVWEEYKTPKNEDSAVLPEKNEFEVCNTEKLVDSIKEEQFNQAVGDNRSRLEERVPKKLTATPEDQESVNSQIVEPTEVSNDYFAAKKFICRIFPLDEKHREERENIFSPTSISALGMKASDRLKKLKDREDFYKAVIAEKLRLQEQYAMRLSSGKLFSWPPSPSLRTFSPMDKYFKNVVEPVEAQCWEPKQNFATKEFTSRELILNRDGHAEIDINSNEFLELNKKYFNRFFRPIDYIKLTPQVKQEILKKSGKLVSKRCASRPTKSPSSSVKPALNKTASKSSSRLKRSNSDENADNFKSTGPFLGFDNSAVKNKKRTATITCEDNFNTDGPFYGFDNSTIKSEIPVLKKCKLEGIDEFDKKISQEKIDFELATKLQENLNRAYNTRRLSRGRI